MADTKSNTFSFDPIPPKSEPKKSTFDFGPSSTAFVKTSAPSSSNGIFSNAGYELWTFPKPVSPPDSHHSSSASSPQLSRSPSPAPPLKLLTAPPSPPKSTQPLASSSQVSTAPASSALFPPQASPWPVASESAPSPQASPAPASPSKLFAAPEPSSQASPAPASPSKLFTAPKPSPQASQATQATQAPSAPAPPSKAPATTPSTQLVPASAPLIKFSAPKDAPASAPAVKFTIPKDLSFGKMSFNKLSLSDSSTNSDTSSPEAIQENQVQTPASAISEPDETTMDTSLESMFLTVKTQQNDEIKTSPLLTLPPLETAPPSHYGLLGVDSRAITKAKAAPKDDQEAVLAAPPSLSASRIFHNVAAPSSTFICGSQGSGKSNTLACLLENCLLPNKFGVLPKPLTGIVFHYDGFNSDAGGLICEAACLASDKRIRVRVVCAPTNIKTIRHTYRNVPGVIIEPLQLRDSHLNTSRMLDLMAVGETNVPLYMRVVGRVLRELRLEQQETGGYFNYQKFKSKMDREDLTDMQRAPLNQRLDTLESFMVQTGNSRHRTNKYAPVTGGNDWTPKAGQLTIVDLSCPCVTAEMACSLFNICLHLFVEGTSPIGRVIALDEAHKYMTMGPESRTLTDNLLGIIRLQRHLGARIIISTQEPTVSPKLLDLCSVTIVHRFTSPDWLRTLQGHLAGVSYMSAGSDESGAPVDEADLYRGAVKPLALGGKNAVMELFAKIVSLRTGEALVFSPSAIIDLRGEGDAQADDIDTKAQVIRLAHRALRVQVRTRLTLDGGRSVMAA